MILECDRRIQARKGPQTYNRRKPSRRCRSAWFKSENGFRWLMIGLPGSDREGGADILC